MAAAVVLAATLRIWGLDYGIPHPTIRPDEERLVGRAQTIFATGNWHPGSFYYPSLPFYIDTLALHGYYRAQELVGRYESPFDFLFDIAVSRPGLHYRIGRAVSAVAGTMTVLAAFVLSLSAYRRPAAAILAAFSLAVCHLHVRDSHFATVDVLMTLFVTLSLVFAVRAARSASRVDFALAGAFAGLAISSKYNAGLVLASISAAAFLKRPFAFGRLALAALAAALAFALTSPYVLLRFAAFWNDMSFLQDFLYGSSTSEPALFSHLRTTLPYGFGWPLFVASALGLVRALWLRRPSDVVLLSFAIPFLALVSSVRITFPRYLLPVTPLLLVLAADFVAFVLEKIPRARLLAAAGTAAFLLAPTLLDSIAFDAIAARDDTRLQAAFFISENFAPRTWLVVCEGYGAPPVNQDRRRPPAFVVEEMDCMKESPLPSDAAFLVTHEHRELRAFSRVHPALGSRLEEKAVLVASFDPYRGSSSVEPVFYGSDAFYVPFAGFEAVERGGPIVKIWKLPFD
ncbi:MAG: ArnT family glycosyltransferase [Vicinamibacteria bacterium]